MKKEEDKIKKLSKKMENFDTCITFGEEALTLRKDDPKTKEFVKNIEDKFVDARKIMVKNDNLSLFHGINLSNERGEEETHEDYKARLKINKDLEKIYKRLGREEAKKQYPEGFLQAIINANMEIKELKQ